MAPPAIHVTRRYLIERLTRQWQYSEWQSMATGGEVRDREAQTERLGGSLSSSGSGHCNCGFVRGCSFRFRCGNRSDIRCHGRSIRAAMSNSEPSERFLNRHRSRPKGTVLATKSLCSAHSDCPCVAQRTHVSHLTYRGRRLTSADEPDCSALKMPQVCQSQIYKLSG